VASSKVIRASTILLVASCVAQAHDPITTKITFDTEIVRIFQKRCLSCHQTGGKAPMSLATYEEARPWAKAIKEEVLERRMPPWGAVKGFGEFRDDRGLTPEEISVIADWVEGGAPEGDPKYLPEILTAKPQAVQRVQGKRLTLQNTLTVSNSVKLVAIEPKTKTDIQSARIVAEQPDGSVEPLIWLRKYKGQWQQTFAFRKPIALAAGSRIRVEPPLPATFVLVTQPGS
jgi:hypothetical protein